MNVLGAGLMDAVAVAALKADVASVLNDANTGTSITLSTPSSTAQNRSSGAWSTTDTSDTVTGLLSTLTARHVELSAGAYRLSDVRLRLLASDLSTDPTTDSRFTASSITYAVIEARKDALGAHWLLIGRATP
jgi:outer membrane translocation and assembly module TamA